MKQMLRTLMRKNLENMGKAKGMKINKDGTMSKDRRFKECIFETRPYEFDHYNEPHLHTKVVR